MATVRHVLKPGSASFLTTAFPQFMSVAGTNFPVEVLAYDASTDEAAFWGIKAFAYGSGDLTLDIEWTADTATTGAVIWESQITAITPDTDSTGVTADSLATLNFVSDSHLGTTARRVMKTSITITNVDSIAANDVVWIRLARDANGTSGTDDMAGDAWLIQATLTYSDT